MKKAIISIAVLVCLTFAVSIPALENTCTVTPTSTISFTVKDETGAGDTTHDFGNILFGSYVNTSATEFRATNTGDSPINIDIQVNDSNNWTYNTYANLAADVYSANWSDDAFATSTNIQVAGSDLKDTLNPTVNFDFDILLWAPTSTTKPLVQQTFKIYYTAEDAS